MSDRDWTKWNREMREELILRKAEHVLTSKEINLDPVARDCITYMRDEILQLNRELENATEEAI